MVSKSELLKDLKAWIDSGIEDDVFWRPEFKPHLELIKISNKAILTKEQIIAELEKQLSEES